MRSVVFLPGMMCDQRIFQPQIDRLSSDYDVTVLPVHGRDTMYELAKNVLNKAPKTFALAGLSMGGILAMEILAQAPDRVERAAFIDTNPCSERDEIKHRRLVQIEKVRQGGLVEVMRDEMKPNYLADGPNRDEVLALCMDMAQGLGAQVFIEQSLALRDRPDYQDVLKSADIPALVMCGEDDQLCPPKRHELMDSLLPQSTLRIVKNAGHLPTLEQPDTVNIELLKWLES